MENKGLYPEYVAPSKTAFFIHLFVYLLAMAILWSYYHLQNVQLHGNAYPWEAWFTGSWFIAVLGHFCNTYFDHNKENRDKQYLKYLVETQQ
ncbi:MAG: 2TM domain-containing protein [Chitinophagaceae bacterium]